MNLSGTHSIQQLVWKIGNEIVYSNGSINYNFIYPGLFDISLIAIDQIGLMDTVLYESLVEIDTLYGDIDWDAEVSENDAGLILQPYYRRYIIEFVAAGHRRCSNSQSFISI